MRKYITLRLVLIGVLVISGLALFLKVNPAQRAELVINASCEDTDSGRKYDVRGTVRYLDRDEGTQFSYTDHCENDVGDSGPLTEYYCDGNVYKYQEYRCPNGCTKGVCIANKALFGRLDINHDGQVSVQEAIPVVSRIYGQVGKQAADAGFDASFDMNKDRAVNSTDIVLYLDSVRQVLSAQDRMVLQAFLTMDSDHNGVLLVTESGPYVSRIEQNLNKRASGMGDTDLNQDGVIDALDLKVFTSAAHLFLANESDSEFDAFVRMDNNHDGHISITETQQTLGALLINMGKQTSDKDFDATLDADQDGKITPKDMDFFQQTIKKLQVK